MSDANCQGRQFGTENRRGIAAIFCRIDAQLLAGVMSDSLLEAKADARSAGLRYSSDSSPGIRRRGKPGALPLYISGWANGKR